MSFKSKKIHSIVHNNSKFIISAISHSMAKVYEEVGFFTPDKKKIFLAPVSNEEEIMEQVLAITNAFTSNEKGRVPVIFDAIHSFNNMIYGWYKGIEPEEWHQIDCKKAAKFCEIYNMEQMYVIDAMIKKILYTTIIKIHRYGEDKWSEKS